MDHFDAHTIGQTAPNPTGWLTRALEGEHPWGYVDVSPAGPTTRVQTRLTVFPPGITGAERRSLKRHRDWPIAGGVFTLFVMLALGEVLSPPVAVAVAVTVYVGGVAFSARRTHELRSRCRRLETTILAGRAGGMTEADAVLLESARTRLELLETRLRHGELNPVEFEAGWGAIYNGLPDERNR